MEANPILFRDLTYIFLAAVAGGLLAWRLKLPLILGFVVGGIVISPFTPGPHLSDLHTFEVFAEVGVVLLMFSIGVEFSVPDLLRVKWIALGGGTLGIMLSIGLALGTAKLFGWSMIQGFVVGSTISVASTMVLARLLADRHAMGTTYGRVMIGITLVEDVAVVFHDYYYSDFQRAWGRPVRQGGVDAGEGCSTVGSAGVCGNDCSSQDSSGGGAH
jgi:CPA2 family monovalent cation:H+ antiporter-2